MCKTRIEKNLSCNHMTCFLCKYEFCWACGDSASPRDNHFNGTGCGVGMMESNVKPGDYLKKKNNYTKKEYTKKERRNRLILKVILCIIF